MKKIKNSLLVVLSALVFTLSLSGIILTMTDSVQSDFISANSVYNTETRPKTAEPRIFANLSFGLSGGDGKVIATAKNNFNLFPSKVSVEIQMYYSREYCTDTNKMTLAKTAYTSDLDMGKSISVEASTDGEERFWLAVMRYKEDSGNWNGRTVSARYSASGEYLGQT